LIGQRRAAFHFLGAFFHDHHGLVRFGLNGFDEGAMSFVALRECSASLRTSSATTAKTAAGFSGASRFDGGVERQQVGLLGDCR